MNFWLLLILDSVKIYLQFLHYHSFAKLHNFFKLGEIFKDVNIYYFLGIVFKEKHYLTIIVKAGEIILMLNIMIASIYQNLDASLKSRILTAIIFESIVFLIIISISINLIIRYRNNDKKHKQIKYMGMTFGAYSAALFFSIIGKTLQYLYGYAINQTELGVISNWSVSLAFISIAAYFQFLFNWQIFPTKERKGKTINKITVTVLVIFVITVPRYFMGTQIPAVHPIKFGSVFVYIVLSYVYYSFSAYRVYTFIRNRFLQKRIIYTILFYLCVMITLIFFTISSVYGSLTGEWYTWGYFVGLAAMVLSAIFGSLATSSGSERDRELLNEEVQNYKQNSSSSIKNDADMENLSKNENENVVK